MEEKKRKRRSPTKKKNFSVAIVSMISLAIVCVSFMVAVSLRISKPKCNDVPHWNISMIPPYSYVSVNICTGEVKQGVIEGSKSFTEQQMLSQRRAGQDS